MTAAAPGGKNPFKGLNSYEETDKDIFFGRGKEGRELYNLVSRNPMTLVFGKSGTGKTSLLNAGLFPLLRPAGFLPVRVRLVYTGDALPPVEQVKLALQEALREHGVRETRKGGTEAADPPGESETLWEYFHRVDHVDAEGKRVTPVVVLDQFEELFTVGKHHPGREALIKELYYLVEDQLPEHLEEALLEGKLESGFLHSEIAVRLVLGLREDYLPHMKGLQERIPSLFRVMYRVIHLDGSRAREVMDRSGAFAGEEIKRDILLRFYPADAEPGRAISDERLEVEPVLLSLLCTEVYEQRLERLTDENKDVIISGFYHRVLESSGGEPLARWIEDHLLTSGGFRTPCYLDRESPYREVVEDAIQHKLLRKLYIGEREHIEIIHDVLAPVIHEERNRRLEAQKRRAFEKEIRRKRVLTGIISLATLIAVTLSILAFMQKSRADRQYRTAVSLRLASESGVLLPMNNTNALRIAEAAYNIGRPAPPPAVQRTVAAAAYSTRERPFFKREIRDGASLNSAVFSPDGAAILTTSFGGTAKLWDRKGRLMAQFTGKRGELPTAVFSPDGAYILIACEDNTAKLWDRKGQLMAELKGHTRPVNSAVFSPDGAYILTASRDGTAKLWDRKGQLMAELKGHTRPVKSAVFSPDGAAILTASWDNTAKLWDRKGRVFAEFKRKTNTITIAVFSPDSADILTIFQDNTTMFSHPDGSPPDKNTAILWDRKGRILAEFEVNAEDVTSAVFSPDGAYILTASWDNTAKLWDRKGRIIAEFKGHTNTVRSAVFSPDGASILTASDDNTAKLWNRKGQLMAELKGHTRPVKSAVFSPGGAAILTASSDKTAKLWTPREQLTAKLEGIVFPARGEVISPDGAYILTTSWGNTAKLWNWKGLIIAEFKGHTDVINTAVFSPDGAAILTASDDNTAKLWDRKGQLSAELKGHTRPVKSAVFSPDGAAILTASWDNTAKLWDRKGQLMAELKGHTSPVMSAVFSPDGAAILTASLDNTAKLWDRRGQLSAELKGHTRPVKSAVFSPDGAAILTASYDNTAKLWDRRGQLRAELKGHTDFLTSAVFSPGGEAILTASDDTTAKLWDLQGKLLADLNIHAFPVDRAAFSLDGKRIVTGHDDGTIITWPTPEAVMDWLKSDPIPRLSEEDIVKLGIEEYRKVIKNSR